MVGFPYLTHFMKNGVMLRIRAGSLDLGISSSHRFGNRFQRKYHFASKHYRFNILVMLILAGLTIGLNFYFSKEYRPETDWYCFVDSDLFNNV
jgi:hypothetical protein